LGGYDLGKKGDTLGFMSTEILEKGKNWGVFKNTPGWL